MHLLTGADTQHQCFHQTEKRETDDDVDHHGCLGNAEISPLT